MTFRDQWLPYVATPDAQEITGIRTAAHQTFDLRGRKSLYRGVRSMLSVFELGLLYAIAKDHWTGAGAIIDAGPLLGASTFALCRGIQDNEQTAEKLASVYSYDLWIADTYYDRFIGSQNKAAKTTSLLQEFYRINREYVDYIVPHQGDFLAWPWPDAPIEVIFMDLAKTWDLNTYYVKNMLPHLIEGGFLVQQDYVHFNEYWVHITMEYFADHFEFLDVLYGGCAAYRLTKKLTPEQCAIDLKALPYEQKRNLLTAAREKMGYGLQQVMKCGAAKCAADHGLLDEARQILETVDTSKQTDNPVENFSGIAGSNKNYVLQIIAAKS